MSDEFQPMRLSRWPGNDATGRPIISKSTKMSLLREGKLRAVRLGGGTWITESWREFVARQAAEQGQDMAAELAPALSHSAGLTWKRSAR